MYLTYKVTNYLSISKVPYALLSVFLRFLQKIGRQLIATRYKNVPSPRYSHSIVAGGFEEMS